MRRVLAQKFGDFNRLINGIFYVFFLIPAGILLMLLFPPSLQVSTTDLIILLGGSIIWPLFNISAFQANKTVDAGIYTIIANLSPLFTLVIAYPFLNEELTLVQYFGMLLLILSGSIAVSPSIKRNDRVMVWGVLWALLSAVLLGVGVAYERFMLNRLDLGTYILFGWGFQVIWMAILAGKEWKYIAQLVRRVGHGTLFIWGSANALKSCFFMRALLLSGSASLMSGATNFVSIVIVIAAFFILNEREHLPQKILGTLVGILGLFLIAF